MLEPEGCGTLLLLRRMQGQTRHELFDTAPHCIGRSIRWYLKASMTTRTKVEIADCDTRAPICDELEDERLNVLQIMAVKLVAA